MTTLNESPIAIDRDDAELAGRSDRSDFDLILESRPSWRAVDFEELYNRRDLLAFWTWRNIKGRHAQSALGIGWAIIQPVTSTVIFTVVFGIMVRRPLRRRSVPAIRSLRHGDLDLFLERIARGR